MNRHGHTYVTKPPDHFYELLCVWYIINVVFSSTAYATFITSSHVLVIIIFIHNDFTL